METSPIKRSFHPNVWLATNAFYGTVAIGKIGSKQIQKLAW